MMTTMSEQSQRQRFAYVSQCAYRETRKFIPDSFDKPLIDTGDHFGNFHCMALYRLVLEHGTAYEKEYMTCTMLNIYENAQSIDIGFEG